MEKKQNVDIQHQCLNCIQGAIMINFLKIAITISNPTLLAFQNLMARRNLFDLLYSDRRYRTENTGSLFLDGKYSIFECLSKVTASC